ncbi:MAG: DNA topoisomerase 3 [Anaerostipes sp.]|nr:DNA topoisomerase 3 [Anaerostipes sp.]MDD3746288.1 DNA topoisomerase 3 [Anaerostipes sp.]
MYLVIAEKPSVSQSIAKVIGAYKKENGYLEGKECTVSWCLGHLAEYIGPEGYGEHFKNWNFEDLPIFPTAWKLAVAKDKKDQYQVLKRLLNREDLEYVVNACDAGREGELIFKRVYDLSESRLPVKRLWISSMEDAAIQRGFQQLKDASEYQNLADASVCRAQADWLIGMNATRAFTTKYFKKLTVGRVQTPTLSMLVERTNQIDGFQKQKYFNVTLDLDDLQVIKQKILEEDVARGIAEACEGATAIITSVDKTEKRINPPKLYDLTTLQREANRYYGMTAKQTLNAAQSLYEKKLITYPRTDSQYLTDDMEESCQQVIEVIKPELGLDNPFAEPVDPKVNQVLNSKKVSDHHAIIPTLEVTKAKQMNLNNEEKKLLSLVGMRLIEAVGTPYIYEETIVKVQCAGEEFQAKGKVEKDAGWKEYEELLNAEKQKEDSKLLPDVQQNQSFSDVQSKISEHYTTPPKPYSEDTLLSAMETAGNKEFDEDTEKKGLGTPATRANIIEKLVYGGYASRKGKQIVPTENGKSLVEVLPDYLKSASMTAEWENQLLEIEQGKRNPKDFMDGIQSLVLKIIDSCKEISGEESHRFQQKDSVGTCPVCGSLMYEGKKNFYCSNRDCSFALWKENRYLERMEKKIDLKMAAQLLKNGRVNVKDLYSAKKNMYFEADLIMEVQDGRTVFSLEFPNNHKKK